MVQVWLCTADIDFSCSKMVGQLRASWYGVVAYEVDVGVRWVRASVRRRDGKGSIDRFVRCSCASYGEVMSHGNEGSIDDFGASRSWGRVDVVFLIEISSG